MNARQLVAQTNIGTHDNDQEEEMDWGDNIRKHKGLM